MDEIDYLLDNVKPEILKLSNHKLKKLLNDPNTTEEDKALIEQLINRRLKPIREALPQFLTAVTNKVYEQNKTQVKPR